MKTSRDYKCLSSYYLKQQLLCSKNNTLATFILPDVNLFVIALNNIVICPGQGRGKGHVVQRLLRSKLQLEFILCELDSMFSQVATLCLIEDGNGTLCRWQTLFSMCS